MIFVFGSNKAGIHGAGAAKYAHKHEGAEYGVGEGLTGNCYALPTKGHKIEKLPLLEILNSISSFMGFARDNPQYSFRVTRVGCGLGGHKDSDIAPLFRIAPENCYFDTAWKPWLHLHKYYWGTF